MLNSICQTRTCFLILLSQAYLSKGKKDSPTLFKYQPDYWIYGNLPEDEYIIFAKFIGERSLIVTVRILRKHKIAFRLFENTRFFLSVLKNWGRLLTTEQKFKGTFPDRGVLKKTLLSGVLTHVKPKATRFTPNRFRTHRVRTPEIIVTFHFEFEFTLSGLLNEE